MHYMIMCVEWGGSRSPCHGQKGSKLETVMRVNVQLGKYTKNENMCIFMAYRLFLNKIT